MHTEKRRPATDDNGKASCTVDTPPGNRAFYQSTPCLLKLTRGDKSQKLGSKHPRKAVPRTQVFDCCPAVSAADTPFQVTPQLHEEHTPPTGRTWPGGKLCLRFLLAVRVILCCKDYGWARGLSKALHCCAIWGWDRQLSWKGPCSVSTITRLSSSSRNHV